MEKMALKMGSRSNNRRKFLHHATYVYQCKIIINEEIVPTLLGVKIIASKANNNVNVKALLRKSLTIKHDNLGFMQTTCVSKNDNAKSNDSDHIFVIRENTRLKHRCPFFYFIRPIMFLFRD